MVNMFSMPATWSTCRQQAIILQLHAARVHALQAARVSELPLEVAVLGQQPPGARSFDAARRHFNRHTAAVTP